MIFKNAHYYLYSHIRLDNNEPFYIGIGKKRIDREILSYNAEYERAFCKTIRNPIWENITKITKYEVNILFETDDYNLILEKEKEFIKLYGRKSNNTGTLSNLTDGGEGINNPSIETRLKISKKLTGIKRSEKTKNKIRLANLGKTVTHTEITKLKISQKNSGKYNGMFGIHGINNKKSKPILQYTLKNEFIKEWVNAREIQNNLGIDYKQISDTCIGKQKTCHGFKWKFK